MRDIRYYAGWQSCGGRGTENGGLTCGHVPPQDLVVDVAVTSCAPVPTKVRPCTCLQTSLVASAAAHGHS